MEPKLMTMKNVQERQKQSLFLVECIKSLKITHLYSFILFDSTAGAWQQQVKFTLHGLLFTHETIV